MDHVSTEPIDCRSNIVSNDYFDFISNFGDAEEVYPPMSVIDCEQNVNDEIRILYVARKGRPELSPENYRFSSIPKVYGLMDTTSMEKSGILRLQSQSVLDLRGQGVMIGVIDTGIDYTHPAFRYSSGETRIEAIWDQSIQTGTAPPNFIYGSEYRREQINEALYSDNPYDIIPSRDENGHGTMLTGIAAGSQLAQDDFVGAAPDATIAMVKLKPAKEYIRKFYLLPPDVEAYQENDIMMGVKYLLELSIELDMPIVILIGLGTNGGGRSSSGNLGFYLSSLINYIGTAVVIPTGNEANRATHYRGVLEQGEEYESAEILVGEGESGFGLQIWTYLPDSVSVGIVSPGGEVVPKMVGRRGTSDFENQFLFEDTIVYTHFILPRGYLGEYLILMNFINPTPGVWTVRVYPRERVSGEFHIWLPLRQFLNTDTRFLSPDPYISLTEPSSTVEIISVSSYNHDEDNIDLYSGRGYTRAGYIKPDLAAPGVDVYGPMPNGRFGTKTGTSIAAAHVAGAAALILCWGIVRRNDIVMDGGSVKGYLVRGARRKLGITYPNQEWGYGALDLYSSFETLRITE